MTYTFGDYQPKRVRCASCGCEIEVKRLVRRLRLCADCKRVKK